MQRFAMLVLLTSPQRRCTLEKPLGLPRALRSMIQTDPTILITDDDRAFRETLESVFAPRGFRIHLAADGEEALRLAAQHGDAIDLLVTDMVMPSMSGAELAERLGRSHPNLKAVFISGYTPEELADEHGAMMNGQFLQKPFPLDALAERVREVLDEQ